ncbi:MAG: Rieske (2Fe-2S) protein [Acidobacteriota bacterium]|nr:Rieske (2Fe-2S) protein [Acidobacteriota bacterium]
MEDRRTVLKSALALGLGVRGLNVLHAQTDDPRRARPQEGDRFVFAFGARQGETVRVDDVPLASEQLICYAMDPSSGAVRDGSRLNQVLLLRFEPDSLTPETREASADGVVAYSGICTHTGCDIEDWSEEAEFLVCSCHDSEFDPRDGAEVISGPAPRRLPSLPLRSEEGVLVAAGGFSATIRFEKEF